MKITSTSTASRAIFSLVVAASMGAPAACADECGGVWSPNFGIASIASGPQAAIVYDSGNGPRLHIGAGPRVLRLENGRWVQLGTNFLANLTGPTTGGGGDIRALAAFNDGTGLKLYAAGTFTRAPGGVVTRNIARWNNTTQAWEAFGNGTTSGTSPTRGITNYALTSAPGSHFVLSLAVHDPDGTGPLGPRLYAGGKFSAGGTVSALSAVSWDGTSWAALPGLPNSSSVNRLVSHDPDGTGPGQSLLIAGGTFTSVAGAPGAQYIAGWNGSAWVAVGDPLVGSVRSLASFDRDGASGPLPPTLIAGTQGPSNIYGLNAPGNTWTLFEEGAEGTVLSMLVRSQPTEDELYIGGDFITVAGGTVSARGVARFTESQGWVQSGDALYTLCSSIGGVGGAPSPTAFTLFDTDGAGPGTPELYAFGQWQTTGGLIGTQNSARLDTSSNTWQAVSTGQGGTSSIPGLVVFDEDGAGPIQPTMYASYFGILGQNQGGQVVRWNRAAAKWESFTSCPGASRPGVLATGIDGGSERLFMGSASTAPEPGEELRVFRNGTFEYLPGPDNTNIVTSSIAGVDFDGSGPGARELFVVRTVGAAQDVLRWNGSAWSIVPGAFAHSSSLYVALHSVNTPTGQQLFATGRFDTIDGVATNNIARFDPGTNAWIALGNGLPGSLVLSAPTYATLNGSTALYAGGTRNPNFTTSFVAKWDGSAWSDAIPEGKLSFLLNGTTSQPTSIQTVTAFNDGDGEGLVIIGTFNALDGVPIPQGITKWNGTSFKSFGGLLAASFATAPVVFDDGTGRALWINNRSTADLLSSNLSVLKAVDCPIPVTPRCNPADIAFDDGSPLPPIGIPGGTNNGVTEGDYNLFFATFFDAGSSCDIANDDSSPLPPFGTLQTNNGVTEGDYNLFFAIYFDGCAF
jgi:hypothetical protein